MHAASVETTAPLWLILKRKGKYFVTSWRCLIGIPGKLVNICKKQCASSTNQVALNRVAYSACLSIEVPSNCFPQAHFGLKQLCKETFGQPHLTTHCISLQRSQSVHGVVFFCRKVTKNPPEVYGNYALTFESDYNLNHWLVLQIVLKSTLIQK